MYKNIVSILNKEEKKKLYKLLVLMVLGAVLELISVGIFIPIIFLIAEGGVEKISMLNKYASYSKPELISFAAILLVTIYLLKALYMTYLAHSKNKYMYEVRGNLSERLFRSYIMSDWNKFLNSNSSEKINTLTNETNQFGTGVIYPLLTLLTEILVGIGFLLFMMAYHTAQTIAIVSLVVIATKIYSIKIKNRLNKWGVERKYFESQRILQVQQSLGGLKELKLFGKENYFANKYNNANNSIVQVMTKQSTLQQIPTIWFEVITISSLCTLVLYMTVNGESMINITATLAVFGGSAFRLMPTFGRITTSLQSLKFNKGVVEHIINELKFENSYAEIVKDKIDFKDAIAIKDVSFKHENADKLSLKNVSITINKNECVGIIGESGAGKSTFVDVLLGILTPTTGSICVDNKNIHRNIRDWHNKIGYVPQNIYLLDDTLRRNIAYGIDEENIDEVKLINAIKKASLETYINSLPRGVNEIVGERGARISGGQRQRIGIARALYNNPEVIILDEATSALDSEIESEIMETVSSFKSSKTVILITHNKNNLKYCDKVYVISNGEIK